jgi:hypothetical protein
MAESYFDRLILIAKGMDVSPEELERAKAQIEAWERFIAQRQAEMDSHKALIHKLAQSSFVRDPRHCSEKELKDVRVSTKNGATWPKPKGSY